MYSGMSFLLYRLPILLLIALQLGACAVISKSECEDNSWQRLGHAAGIAGDADSQQAFTKRAQVCAKYGLSADQNAFEVGYSRGIDQYCELSNAVVLGARGKVSVAKQQVCPESRYIGFQSAFDKGYVLHKLQKKLAEVQAQVDQLSEREYHYQHRRRQLAQQISSGELNSQQVQNAKHQRRNLTRNIYHVRSAIRSYSDLLKSKERAVRDYKTLLDSEFGNND